MTQEQYSFVHTMAERIKEDPTWLEAVIAAATEGAERVKRQAAQAKSYIPVVIARADEIRKKGEKTLIETLKKGMSPEGFIALGLTRDNYPGWKELPTKEEIEKKLV